MSQRIPDAAKNMSDDTVESLQELVQALRDSGDYLTEAAECIKGDEIVANTLRNIADHRKLIRESIGGFITKREEVPVEDGSFLSKLRSIWTTARAGLNAGDAGVVLIEAERAEDVIVNKFKQVLPEIAGNPINDVLLRHFKLVKQGHDQVRDFRDAYQNA